MPIYSGTLRAMTSIGVWKYTIMPIDLMIIEPIMCAMKTETIILTRDVVLARVREMSIDESPEKMPIEAAPRAIIGLMS